MAVTAATVILLFTAQGLLTTFALEQRRANDLEERRQAAAAEARKERKKCSAIGSWVERMDCKHQDLSIRRAVIDRYYEIYIPTLSGRELEEAQQQQLLWKSRRAECEGRIFRERACVREVLDAEREALQGKLTEAVRLDVESGAVVPPSAEGELENLAEPDVIVEYELDQRQYDPRFHESEFRETYPLDGRVCVPTVDALDGQRGDFQRLLDPENRNACIYDNASFQLLISLCAGREAVLEELRAPRGTFVEIFDPRAGRWQGRGRVGIDIFDEVLAGTHINLTVPASTRFCFVVVEADLRGAN